MVFSTIDEDNNKNSQLTVSRWRSSGEHLINIYIYIYIQELLQK